MYIFIFISCSFPALYLVHARETEEITCSELLHGREPCYPFLELVNLTIEVC
jgi:hypothetical protein